MEWNCQICVVTVLFSICNVLKKMCPVLNRAPLYCLSLSTLPRHPPLNSPPKFQSKSQPRPLPGCTHHRALKLIIVELFNIILVHRNFKQVYCMYFNIKGHPELPVQREGLKKKKDPYYYIIIIIIIIAVMIMVGIICHHC